MDGARTPTADRPANLPAESAAAMPEAHLPTPPSERGAWLLAGAIGAIGVAVLVLALSGLFDGTPAPPAQPPLVVRVATSTPASARLAGVAQASGAQHAGGRPQGAIVARPSISEQRAEEQQFIDQTETHISTRWMEGFYPIYAVAQQTFGVNWLLIASIHRQESAFSTAPGTYHGLNFAGCCGGPMQFNVTNGPVTTWQLVENSYIYGRRPRSYDHMTAKHPSIYDDFDAIMAAAHLLSVDGAEYALDDAAWDAAYDYYGHDADGVTYADQVLARAIGWSQHGFCINCGISTSLVEAVHAAYGAPVLAALEAESAAAAKPARPAATKPARTKPEATKPAGTKPAGTKPAATKPAGRAPAAAKR